MNIGLGFDAAILSQRRSTRFLKGLDVLLFPELVDGGYAALALGAAPHRLRDAFLDSFRNTSRRFPLCCIAGSTCFETGSSLPTNTSLAFSGGRLVHRYDKIHLFKPTGDHQYFQRGKHARVFSLGHNTNRINAGVVICYDLRFPELIRILALQGMKLLCVPARWPRSRDEAWWALLKARAIENQIFVVGCNARGEEGGYSYAFDPMGTLIFSNKGKHDRHFFTFRLELERLQAARRLQNNLKDAVLLKHLVPSLIL